MAILFLLLNSSSLKDLLIARKPGPYLTACVILLATIHMQTKEHGTMQN